jgi:predicted protein tyrosine phosphatase
MIHVCSLSRLHATLDETGARHIVTLLRLVDRVQRPDHIAPENHLVLSVDDITMPMDGYTLPANDHVQRLINFVTTWDRKTPMVMHCFAGISRSTAAAYVAACALNPQRDEMQIAWGYQAILTHRAAEFAHRLRCRPPAQSRRPHDPRHRRHRPRRCSNRRPPVPARFALTHRVLRPLSDVLPAK